MTENAVVPAEPQGLDLALLKAVGLDRAAPEQRQLAIAIAERYGLDLMLKHLVLIEGRPYVTRDALIHIATTCDRDSLRVAIAAALSRPDADVRWRALRCAQRAGVPRRATEAAHVASRSEPGARSPEPELLAGPEACALGAGGGR